MDEKVGFGVMVGIENQGSRIELVVSGGGIRNRVDGLVRLRAHNSGTTLLPETPFKPPQNQ